MTRVKKGVNAIKRRRSVLKQTKGFRFRRSTNERAAKDALVHAGAHAFAHRRDKKSDRRRLNTVKMNAAVRVEGMSYSKLIDAMKKKGVLVDRKIMAQLAENKPAIFKKVVEAVK